MQSPLKSNEVDITGGLAICVQDVNLTYGEGMSTIHCLNGTSINVRKGTIYALLGPSGCGKTSLLRCVLNCIKPQSGRIRIFGYKPGDRKSQIPGPGVGYMPQETALNEDLTITEMLTYFGELAFMDRQYIKMRIAELISELDLPNSDQIISTLSGGQKRRVSFVCALIHKPKLLILDEPTVGVDPILREKIWDILINCTQIMNTTIVITTHYIEETRRSNRIGFMRKGKLLAEDSPENMLTRFRCKTLEDVFYKLCTKERMKSKMDALCPPMQIMDTKFDQNNYKRNSIHTKAFEFFSSINFNHWSSVLLTVVWKVTIQSLRLRSAFILQFILPIFSIFAFCLCIGGIAKDVPIAVVNDESPPFLSELYLNNIDQRIVTILNYSDFNSAISALKKGKIWSVLHINANFSVSLINRYQNIDDVDEGLIKMGQITAVSDLTNRVLAMTLERAFEAAFDGFTVDALKKLNYNPRLLDVPIRLEEVIHGRYSKIFKFTDVMVPGLLILMTYTFSFINTLFLTMSEKREKIFDRNRVAGVTTAHIILSHLISRFIFMSITSIVLFVIALLFFDLQTKGSIFWAFILLFLQIIAGLTMGIMISTICTDFTMAIVLGNGVLLFIFIISGVLWSTEALPYWMEWFSFIQPTTLPTKSLRNILSRGLRITEFYVYRGYFVSVLYIGIFFFISHVFFPH